MCCTLSQTSAHCSAETHTHCLHSADLSDFNAHELILPYGTSAQWRVISCDGVFLSYDCWRLQCQNRCLWFHSAWQPDKSGHSFSSRWCEWLIPNSLCGPRLELRLKPASVLVHMTYLNSNLLFKVLLHCLICCMILHSWYVEDQCHSSHIDYWVVIQPLISWQLVSVFTVLKIAFLFFFYSCKTWTVTVIMWVGLCAFLSLGPQQAGDALLAAAVAAETLGIQQHTWLWPERQLELPDPGPSSHRPCRQRKW